MLLKHKKEKNPEAFASQFTNKFEHVKVTVRFNEAQVFEKYFIRFFLIKLKKRYLAKILSIRHVKT